MIRLLQDLWKTPRHLISDGYDEALNYIKNIIPIKIIEIPSGTKCWTWIVPEKWSVEEAWIEDLEGNRLLDLKDHPLHIMSYSLPKDEVVSKEELLKHIHTYSERPNAIPFEFKYYERDWGFCIEHNKLNKFTKEQYKVLIKSNFQKGNLKIGELTIPGQTKETIVLVAHLDHPAMANDDLAGVSVLVDERRVLPDQAAHVNQLIQLVHFPNLAVIPAVAHGGGSFF